MMLLLNEHQTTKTGTGVLNSLINKLPVELHIPGYQFCGPGTKLQKRLERGDIGVNRLDAACREHDIAYARHSGLPERHKADIILANKALERYRARDSTIGEKLAALGVSGAMKAKVKLGMGSQRRRRVKKNKKNKRAVKKNIKKISFSKAVKLAKSGLNNLNNIYDNAKIAISSFKKIKKTKLQKPRIIRIPKTGGILPLIPIFAGLSALGSLAGGTAGVVKAINDARSANKKLNEMKRHNETMESIALGKGLYLKPYKTGLGLHVTNGDGDSSSSCSKNC